MAKFTYLLGAGASKNVIPIVSDFSSGMYDYANSINNINFQNTDDNRIKQRLLESLKSFAEEAKKNYSFDTLAKKFYLQNDHMNLKKLKLTLSCYLLACQSIKNVDYRYRAFFSSILNKENDIITFPDNVRVLCWNYDTQFELCFEEYEKELIDNNTVYALQAFPYSNSNITFNPNKFSILHLNGVCGGYSSPGYKFNKRIIKLDNQYYQNVNDQKKEILKKIIDIYQNMEDENVQIYLNFAWEEKNNYYRDIVFKNIDPSVHDTDYLIVIGYSFPFYNRKVDKFILGSMKRLRKVYIQCPQEDQAKLQDRFHAVCDKIVDIQPIIDLDQFYIPYEF